MASFILIHGAWHGPWCWYKLTPILEKLGHKVVEVDLSKAETGRVNVKTYTNYVEEIITQQDTKPIILGHSMAGVILSSLNVENIDALVYLNAYLLDDESIIDIVNLYPSTGLQLEFKNNFSLCKVKDQHIESLFYNLCSQDDIDYAKPMLKFQPYHVFNQKIKRINSSINTYYIGSKYDNMVSNAAKEFMLTRFSIKKTYKLNSDHSPFFSDTDNLSNILNEIALH